MLRLHAEHPRAYMHLDPPTRKSLGLAAERPSSGDDLVGISFLSYPPVRGIVFTNWTGTARAARGRGIARALKCETVMQAIAAGVDRVRTGNDEANAPILHLNESMGYRPIPGWIEFVRAARATDRKGDEA